VGAGPQVLQVFAKGAEEVAPVAHSCLFPPFGMGFF
jgi:hypothetical protein